VCELPAGVERLATGVLRSEEEDVSQRCPVCGSPPSHIDYIDVPSEDCYTKSIPAVLHCPNERDARHRPVDAKEPPTR
jgi:hypothetical protein